MSFFFFLLMRKLLVDKKTNVRELARQNALLDVTHLLYIGYTLLTSGAGCIRSGCLFLTCCTLFWLFNGFLFFCEISLSLQRIRFKEGSFLVN